VFDHVSVKGVGRDGTVALYRWYYGLYTTFQETIWRKGKETPVTAFGHAAQLSDYRDARNYAGSFYEDESQNSSAMMPPSEESVAFVVESGRIRIVGRGRVAAWNPGGAVATRLRVDDDGKPAGSDIRSEEHVRVFEKGRTYDLGRVRVLGRRADGAFVLIDTVPPSAESVVPDPLGLYLWRQGRLEPWVRLPKGWEAIAFEPQGTVLLRKEGQAGLLKGSTLTPLRVSDPRVGEALGYTDAADWLRPDSSFAFSTGGIGPSGHDERKTYTLRPSA